MAQSNANPAIDAVRQRVPAPYLKYHVTALVCSTTGDIVAPETVR
ncbi:MAG: hypothetical protein ACRD2Z_13075 [Thermoanaerobaculia bacterium]